MLRQLTVPRTFTIVVFLGLVSLSARTATDPDLWWHLSTGRLIVESQAVPHTDPFSYSRPGAPWIAHEWLADVALFELMRTAGPAGLIALFAAVSVSAFAIIYVRCPGSPFIAGIFTLLGALAIAPILGVRPQILSFLFTSILLWLLEQAFVRPRLLWFIPFLFLAWVNLHAAFGLGIAIFVVFTIDAAMNSYSSRNFILSLILSLIAIAANPNTWRMYWYPIDVLRSSRMKSQIAEWFSPDFHQFTYSPFLLMILLLMLGLFFSHKRLRWRDLVLLLCSIYAALVSVRHITIFVLIAVPILARVFGDLIWTNRPTSNELPVNELPVSARALTNLFIIAIAFSFSGTHLIRVIQAQPTDVARAFPAGAVNYLAAEKGPRKIFGLYDWGGYLIWRLYPEQFVFIDGRADVYGEQLLKQFSDTYTLRHNWREGLAEAGAVIVPVASALSVGLTADTRWRPVYRDQQAVVFLRSDTGTLLVPENGPKFYDFSPALGTKRR